MLGPFLCIICSPRMSFKNITHGSWLLIFSLAPQSLSFTLPQVRVGPLQMSVHFAVWLEINQLVSNSSKSPSPLLETPSVSLPHDKSSAEPPGTQCMRSLKDAQGKPQALSPRIGGYVQASLPDAYAWRTETALQGVASSLNPLPWHSPPLSLCIPHGGEEQEPSLKKSWELWDSDPCLGEHPGTW